MYTVQSNLASFQPKFDKKSHLNAVRQIPWRLKLAGVEIVEDESDSIIVNST